MKITPTLTGNRPAPATSGSGNGKNSTATGAASARTYSADEITQAGLQSAQKTLNNDARRDVDEDKVAQMQAALANGSLKVDTDQLASDMLNFFR